MVLRSKALYIFLLLLFIIGIVLVGFFITRIKPTGDNSKTQQTNDTNAETYYDLFPQLEHISEEYIDIVYLQMDPFKTYSTEAYLKTNNGNKLLVTVSDDEDVFQALERTVSYVGNSVYFVEGLELYKYNTKTQLIEKFDIPWKTALDSQTQLESGYDLYIRYALLNERNFIVQLSDKQNIYGEFLYTEIDKTFENIEGKYTPVFTRGYYYPPRVRGKISETEYVLSTGSDHYCAADRTIYVLNTTNKSIKKVYEIAPNSENVPWHTNDGIYDHYFITSDCDPRWESNAYQEAPIYKKIYLIDLYTGKKVQIADTSLLPVDITKLFVNRNNQIIAVGETIQTNTPRYFLLDQNTKTFRKIQNTNTNIILEETPRLDYKTITENSDFIILKQKDENLFPCENFRHLNGYIACDPPHRNRLADKYIVSTREIMNQINNKRPTLNLPLIDYIATGIYAEDEIMFFVLPLTFQENILSLMALGRYNLETGELVVAIISNHSYSSKTNTFNKL